MDLVVTKIVVLTLLGAIRLVCGLLPLKITKHLRLWGENPDQSQLLVERRRRQIERGISLCLCFGGGVLLATCFIHMLPEARESLKAAQRAAADANGSDEHPSGFPYAELFICVGFFLVYIIEEIAHRVFLRQDQSSKAKEAKTPGEKPSSEKTPAPAITSAAPPPCCATIEGELQKIDAGSGVVANGDAERAGSVWSRPRSTSKIAPATSQVHLLASTLSLEQPKDPNAATAVVVTNGAVPDAHHHHHHLHGHHHHHHHHEHHDHNGHVHHHTPLPSDGEQTVMGHVRSILVVLALSFHSVFEGLAIGLQPTQRDVWYLFTAVAIHASAILFCVGLELVMSGMKLLTMLAYLGVLSVVSPLGVVLGVVITSAGGDGEAAAGAQQTLAVGVLQGIAGGTILYITFFEVLEREKRKEDNLGLLRLACVLAGFAVMVALQVVGGHEHGGEDGSHQLAGNFTHEAAHHHHHH